MIHPQTPQDEVRRLLNVYLEQAGRRVGGWGVHPDTITTLGLVVVVAAAAFIATGHHVFGGVILLVGLPLDALDGAVARATQKVSKFGGVLDSVLDRFAEGALFMALSHYYYTQSEPTWASLCQLALIASFGVSYVRARAGQAGLDVRVGLMDRMVRLGLLLVGLFINSLLMPLIFVIAWGSVFTSIHRLLYTKANLHE